MIDFHNHILPDVDDGPKTIEESLLMLKYAEQQGITQVINTVHFQHPKMEGKNVEYDYLMNKVNNLESLLNEKKINVKIHLASEVFYMPNLVEIASNPIATMSQGRYMLIEFKTNIFPFGYEDEFYNLQLKGITPIIAHPERYRFIQNDINILEKWKERDYMIQIDAGSLLGHFGEMTKKITLEMCKKFEIDLVGSDAHNVKKRNFCLKDAYQVLQNQIGESGVLKMKNNSKKLIMKNS